MSVFLQVPGVQGSQKRASDTAELELPAVVSHHIRLWELNFGALVEQPQFLSPGPLLYFWKVIIFGCNSTNCHLFFSLRLWIFHLTLSWPAKLLLESLLRADWTSFMCCLFPTNDLRALFVSKSLRIWLYYLRSVLVELILRGNWILSVPVHPFYHWEVLCYYLL